MCFRDCKVCKKRVNTLFPDPCLGTLPGVRYACCGHGEPEGGYIMFENGTTIYFQPTFITDAYSDVPDDCKDENGLVITRKIAKTNFLKS